LAKQQGRFIQVHREEEVYEALAASDGGVTANAQRTDEERRRADDERRTKFARRFGVNTRGIERAALRDSRNDKTEPAMD